MYGAPLKQAHLARLSPVMHAYGRSVIRAPLTREIEAVGNYETIDPRASSIWSNLYRVGAAGALSRVAPFGPSSFGADQPTEEQPVTTTGPSGSAARGWLRDFTPLLVSMGLAVGVCWLASR